MQKKIRILNSRCPWLSLDHSLTIANLQKVVKRPHTCSKVSVDGIQNSPQSELYQNMKKNWQICKFTFRTLFFAKYQFCKCTNFFLESDRGRSGVNFEYHQRILSSKDERARAKKHVLHCISHIFAQWYTWWYSKFSPKHPLTHSAEKKSEFWTQGFLDYSLTIPWLDLKLQIRKKWSSTHILARPYGLMVFKIRFRASPTRLWKKNRQICKFKFCTLFLAKNQFRKCANFFS